MNLIRKILVHVAAVYMSVGVVQGALLYYSIPAMNVLGWAYYAVTWPEFVCYGAKVCHGDPWVPRWAFTPPQDRQFTPE